MQYDNSSEDDYDLLDLIMDMVTEDSDKELLELLLRETDDEKVFQLLLERIKQEKNDQAKL